MIYDTGLGKPLRCGRRQTDGVPGPKSSSGLSSLGLLFTSWVADLETERLDLSTVTGADGESPGKGQVARESCFQLPRLHSSQTRQERQRPHASPTDAGHLDVSSQQTVTRSPKLLCSPTLRHQRRPHRDSECSPPTEPELQEEDMHRWGQSWPHQCDGGAITGNPASPNSTVFAKASWGAEIVTAAQQLQGVRTRLGVRVA